MASPVRFVRAVVAIVFICLATSVGADDDRGAVAVYTADTFNNELVGKANFVMFYAPWCGHCKRLAPTWDELAKKYNGNPDELPITIAKVDCTVDTKVCADQDISGYPTLKLFWDDGAQFVRFQGTRDLASLVQFVENHMLSTDLDKDTAAADKVEPSPGLVDLEDASFTEHVKYGKHFVKFFAPWCMHCQQMAPAWEQLAQAYSQSDQVSIAQVDCTTQRTVCDIQDIQGYPTLVWFQDGRKVEQYNGGRSVEELAQYVARMLERPPPVQTNDGAIPDKVVEDSVLVLTDEDFDAVVGENLVFVKFFAPWCGHCKRLAPIWEDLGKKNAGRGDIKVAEVDCTKQPELCQRHKIRGYPTLVMFRNGVQLGEFSGPRTVDSLQDFINTHLGSRDEL